MTLDDLLNIGNEASDDVAAKAERMGLCPSGVEMGRARVKAIVEALQPKLELYFYAISQDVTEKSARAFADGFVDEILASDGEEAAGGSTREGGRADGGDLVLSNTAESLKAPAAGLVCVWTRRGDGLFFIPCDHRANLPKPQQQVCQYCNRPIKFKEGSE